MLLNILIVLLVALLLLAAFILIRAVMFPRRLKMVEPVELPEVDGAAAVRNLSEIVRLETVSHVEASDVDSAAFTSLHLALARQYPHVHTTLRREVVSEYSLLYTWVGSQPDLPPVLLTAHLDVVPADPATLEQWTYPPFSGEIADGYVWGRGTLDIKSQVIATLSAVEHLLEKGYEPRRTILLAFGEDEESTGKRGAESIARLLEERDIHPAIVVDEGGTILEDGIPGVSAGVALIGAAEKGYLTLHLRAKGEPGHSSTPPRHTAIGTLARALALLSESPFPARLGLLREMYRALGPAVSFPMQILLANTWLTGGLLERKLRVNPQTDAAVRTTIAPTVVHSGVKDNVLPAEAEALVNFRLLPGDTIAGVCERVRKIIGDDRVSFEPKENSAWEASVVSPDDGPAYETLEKTVQQVFPDVIVAPYIVEGATDARYYARICGNVYRFSPMRLSDEDLAGVHGINERIRVEVMEQMVQFYVMLIQNLDTNDDL